MIRNPCYDSKTNTDCENRCTGCSTICALWHDYVERRNELYNKRKKEAEAEQAFIDHQERLRERVRRRKNSKERKRG